jgi:hypothetical protein
LPDQTAPATGSRNVRLLRRRSRINNGAINLEVRITALSIDETQRDDIAVDLGAGHTVIQKLIPVGCGVIRRWTEGIIDFRREAGGIGFGDAGSRARCDAGNLSKNRESTLFGRDIQARM